MQRVIVNFAPESSIDADLFIRYDYEAKESARPAAYPLDSADVAAIYGTATYGLAHQHQRERMVVHHNLYLDNQ